jgi:hypothetical protein
MDLITKLRFQGYASTPMLWEGNVVSQFKQIELSNNPKPLIGAIVFKNQRLGKLVEEFVFYQLKQQHSITWISDNLQIQNGKQTVGEIDALYIKKEQPIHLEIVYKFYLYDSLEKHSEPLAYWIGPNRKDSFLYKLDKLNSKQFPLLYNELTQPTLDNYNVDIKIIKQKLCFKAQLFLPYNNRDIDVAPLNPNCIQGYYISFNKIKILEKLEFFIPEKLDWLVTPYHNVKWLDYYSGFEILKKHIDYYRSPLIWVRSSETRIEKCFVTWW